MARQGVHQELDTVLRAYSAADCTQNSRHDGDMREHAPVDQLKHESNGTVGVAAYIIHGPGTALPFAAAHLATNDALATFRRNP